MGKFKDIYLQEGTPEVNRLISNLEAKTSNGKYINVNKYIKINTGSTYDGNYVYIDYDKHGYAWFISEKKDNRQIIDQSDDYFIKIKDCLNDFRKLIQ